MLCVTKFNGSWKIDRRDMKVYSDLGCHPPMHQVFAWAPQILVFSYIHAQIHASFLQKQVQSHTADDKFKLVNKKIKALHSNAYIEKAGNKF